MKMIEVQSLCKKYGELEVLKGVNFTLNKGEVIGMIGPSGSGKSTLLRCLIDLEKADSGHILIEGNHLCKDGIYPKESEIRSICLKMGMVFQHFNLFPHLSVKDNLKVAPKLLKYCDEQALDALCDELLKKVGLLDKKDIKPSSLSGGQKQRVAIARALMLKPDIILFDEPTSALDPELTKEVLNVIKDLANDDMTMIIVTHEINFAKEAADKIIFMDAGVIVDEGTPAEIISNPKHERIKTFFNLVD